jgi:hypothetical protein
VAPRVDEADWCCIPAAACAAVGVAAPTPALPRRVIKPIER